MADELTPVEKQILQLYADGYDHAEISRQVHFSVSYLERKVCNRIYKKLGVADYVQSQNRRTNAVAIGFRKGLIV